MHNARVVSVVTKNVSILHLPLNVLQVIVIWVYVKLISFALITDLITVGLVMTTHALQNVRTMVIVLH